MTDQAVLRNNMVVSQLRPNKVVDQQVIDAMSSIARELFVPKALSTVAYIDEDIAVAPGRYLIEPVCLARMVQAAEIGEGDIVLDIGSATGYSSAVLAQIAGTVVALENDEALAAQAEKNLAELQIDNVAVMRGELTDGLAAQGPYDVIFINGAVAGKIDGLLGQLADGGRLVCIWRTDAAGKAVLYSRTGDIVGQRELFDASAILLPGFEPEKAFSL